MKTMEKTFRIPRQFSTCVYQYFGALLLFASILFMIPTIHSFIQWSPEDILIGSTLSFPPLILGAAIIFFTQKHIPYVSVDTVEGILKIKKKGREDEIHELREIKKFVFNLQKFPFPGFRQIKINAEIGDGTNVNIFSDDIVLSGKSWEWFSEKLSKTTNKPLYKATLIENQNGKLILE